MPSTKIKKSVNKQELAKFFHDLAKALENGGSEELACVDDFSKIKIAIKNEFGQISLKAKISPAETCDEPATGDEPGAPAKPKYKHLKKRMKSSFKLIVKHVHDGEVPPAEAVESFLDDSALMVTYPGYGDEYYAQYTEVCESFRAAFESGDMDKMHAAVDALVHEKSRCHAKYD